MSSPPTDDVAWNGFGNLDKLLEHRVRLGICVLASRVDEINFRRLKQLLEETDGSLGAHLRKLEDAGYVKARKTFAERKPVTWYSLTRQGRQRLGQHVESLGQLLQGLPGEGGE